jgi:hypothetical protein
MNYSTNDLIITFKLFISYRAFLNRFVCYILINKSEGETLTNFFAVVMALEQGRSVRMSRWEAITRMFIQDGVTVCQRGDAAPYEYELSWKEMQANKWQVIQGNPAT